MQIRFEVGALVLERIELLLASITRPARNHTTGPRIPGADHVAARPAIVGRRNPQQRRRGQGVEGGDEAAGVKEVGREVEERPASEVRRALGLRRHGRNNRSLHDLALQEEDEESKRPIHTWAYNFNRPIFRKWAYPLSIYSSMNHVTFFNLKKIFLKL